METKATVDMQAVHATGFGNVAFDGGVIAATNRSHLFLDSVNFANNVAEYGGAIDVFNAYDLVIKQSMFYNNSAIYGGAVRVLYSEGTITNSLFELNTASSNGGALRTWDSKITVDSSNFLLNKAGQGGAIFACCQEGHVTISKSTFAQNAATSFGDGIYCAAYHRDAVHLVLGTDNIITEEQIYNWNDQCKRD